jgi:hypothetical protein
MTFRPPANLQAADPLTANAPAATRAFPVSPGAASSARARRRLGWPRPWRRAKIDHVEIDEVAAEVIREVARRILADETGKITCASEAFRLSREGIPSPADRLAQLYARPVKGGPWVPHAIKHILTSEAALGYLMHGGRPVIGADGRPVRLAEPLWDRPRMTRW